MPPDGTPQGSGLVSEDQRQLIALVVKVGAMERTVGELNSTIQNGNRDSLTLAQQLATMQANLDTALRELKTLNVVLLRGNGQPSFQQRLSTLEEATAGQDQEIEKLRKNLNARVHARELSRGQLIVGGLGILAAIITSLVSAAAVISSSG